MTDINDKLEKTQGTKIIREDPKLAKYLKQTFRLEEIRMKKKSERGTHDEKEIANNNDEKVDVLDKYIFGSMANLIYFFKFLAEHPNLVSRFDEDIEELLALKTDPSSDITVRSKGFQTLINLMVNYGQYTRTHIDEEKFNFKRHLLPIMQKCVSNNTSHIITHGKSKDGMDGKGLLFKVMVENHFREAELWTQLVDRPTTHQNKRIKRKILFK